MRVQSIGPGLFRASMRHGVQNFFWDFTPLTLQDALRSVTATAAEGEIDYSHAANMTLGMRMAVQDYEAAPCYFEQILERAGVI